MNGRPAYQYIFDMLDYADILYAKISPDAPEKNSYFMTLVYIEDILNTYGRGAVLQDARDAGLSDEEALRLMQEATRRMDQLRGRMGELTRTYDFSETLKATSRRILTNWGKLSDMQ